MEPHGGARPRHLPQNQPPQNHPPQHQPSQHQPPQHQPPQHQPRDTETAVEDLCAILEAGDEAELSVGLKDGSYIEFMKIPAAAKLCTFILAKFGHDHLLPYLLDAGMTLDKNYLVTAAKHGHLKMVEALLKDGANPVAGDPETGKTALSCAADKGEQLCVAALLSFAESNSCSESPVFDASTIGDKKAVELLAEAGWPLTFTDSSGCNSLHYAAMTGSVEVAEYLVKQGVDPLQESHDELMLPLDIARIRKQQAMVEFLTKNGYTSGRTKELVYAVWEGDEARVKAAISNGGNPKVKMMNEGGQPACLMSMSAFCGHYHLVQCLLEAGLGPEGSYKSSLTPLMLAASKGHTQMVYELLNKGADPLVTDEKEYNALTYAVACGQLQCLAVLLPLLPSNFMHRKDNKLMHLASFHGHIDIVEMLVGDGWSLTVKDDRGLTPLHWAVMGGQKEIVKYLVSEGLDPLEKIPRGDTSIDMAMIFGHYAVSDWLEKNKGVSAPIDESRRLKYVRIQQDQQQSNHLQTVSWLMECDKAIMNNIPMKHDGHVMDVTGLTPLHVAAERGMLPKMVEKSLQCGMSPHVITPDNKTPADLAMEKGHKEVLKALKLHQCKQDKSSGKLYEELLSTISVGDDVRVVSRFLCQNTPTEPLGGRSLSALQLAVTCNRSQTVNLLLASGASLSAGLLELAWKSPNTAPNILAALINAYCCRLRVERRNLETISNTLVKGIDDLLKIITGDTPWEAAWPQKSTHVELSLLLNQAVRANSPVTAGFLHKAGAWPFFSGSWGTNVLHAALEADHHNMVEMLIRDLRACPYVPDSKGRLPINLMSVEERWKLEQRLFEEERARLEDLEVRQKADEDKLATKETLNVQQMLFDCYTHDKCNNPGLLMEVLPLRPTMLLASRKGLMQLAYLLLVVGRFPVDMVLDDSSNTTALHQAASHGQNCCVELLISAGSDPVLCDAYDQTPCLLAAMFGHQNTCYLLEQHHEQDLPCRAGTIAKNVKQNFDDYLRKYDKMCDRALLTPIDHHDHDHVRCKLLKSISLQELQWEAQRVTVDFSKGEAKEVRKVIMAELKTIMEKVSAADPTYRGKLSMVGSSQDGSKLYAPDEFDVNIVIKMDDDVNVEVTERKCNTHLEGKLEILMGKGQPQLEGNRFMHNLYEEVQHCLAHHFLNDDRLSIVPPGVTRTQVGVALALAWQGKEYPLLLIGVDLVPVLEVPWQKKIYIPDLTPKNTNTIQLSNAADGSWRCSFAQIEADVLGSLSPSERLLQIMGKILLSSLKAEPWMPRCKKNFCTWFTTREWKILVPSGFCFKNAFLLWLEQHRRDRREEDHTKSMVDRLEENPTKMVIDRREENPTKCVGDRREENPTKCVGDRREENPTKCVVDKRDEDPAKLTVPGWKMNPAKQLVPRWAEDSIRKVIGGREEDLTKVLVPWEKEDLGKQLIAIFKNMCANLADSGEVLVSQNISPYFGGECEGSKPGDGAHLIVQCLEDNLQNLCLGAVGHG